METAPPPPAQGTLDLGAITETYIKIRDARLAAKKQFDAVDEDLKGKLEKLEGVMLKHLAQHGMESVRTEAGTFYRQQDIKPNIVDDTAFYGWIKANDAFDALERRVKKTFISEFMKSHDDTTPPGIAVHREYVCRVRRGD